MLEERIRIWLTSFFHEALKAEKRGCRDPYTCLGKNLSLMELNKLVQELVLGFVLELLEKDAEWRVYDN